MICKRCGSSMDDSYIYCTHCGEQLGSSQAQLSEAPGDQPASRRFDFITVLVILLIVSIIFTVLLAFGVISFSADDVVMENSPDPYAAVVVSPTATPPAIEPLGDNDESGADVYILTDSDKRYLDKSELESLSWEQLCLARNEIFARHGLVFGVQEIDDYFNSQSWYTPVAGYDEFSFDALSAIETANASMMYDYETARFGRTYY